MHIISRCVKKTLDGLVPAAVTSLIRLSLSLLDSGKMILFRKALAMEIEARELVIVQGSLSPAAAQHRQVLMALLIHRHPQALTRQVLLDLTANGDWRDSTKLIHVVPIGRPVPEHQQLQKQFQHVLTQLFAGTNPVIFPRHRWTGSEESITYYSLLWFCHGLLLPTYRRILTLTSSNSSKPTQATSGVVLGLAVERSLLLDDAVDGEMLVSAMSSHEEEALVGNTAWPDPSSFTATIEKEITQADVNARNRSHSLAWLESKPEAELLIMQVVVQPLTDLLNKQLESAGATFTMVERAKVAIAMMSGQSNVDGTCGYQVLQAASGRFENEFLVQAHHLLEWKNVWDVLHCSCRTTAARALAHRVLSRAASTVYQLLGTPHKLFPLKLFRILVDASSVQELVDTPSCQKDSWTLALERQFGSLAHPSVKQILLGQSLLQRTDITCIEAKHASLRRFLLSRSLQTWRFGIGACSAEWLMQQCRRLLRKPAGKKVLKKEVLSLGQTKQLAQHANFNLHPLVLQLWCFRNFTWSVVLIPSVLQCPTNNMKPPTTASHSNPISLCFFLSIRV
eukprot:6460284-Amphidinium_carterae.1